MACKGVYILSKVFQPVYVGKSNDQPMGSRVRVHLKDRLAGRWDAFSWFSLSSVRVTTIQAPGKRQIGPDTIISTLEAFGIFLADTPLNRRHETIPGAIEVTQIPTAILPDANEAVERIAAMVKEKL